ncbi:MAG: hypothetical protein KF774_16010 [Planctomyces sp.]|nr:hypothetical protein [Planctomyces sp.]
MTRTSAVIAALAACLLIFAGARFCSQTRDIVADQIRSAVGGGASTETDDASGPVSDLARDFGMELSAGLATRIQIADVLTRWWPFWAAATFAACFGAAALLGRGPHPTHASGVGPAPVVEPRNEPRGLEED